MSKQPGILCMLHAQSFSHVWLCVTPWTVALQAPLSTGFSRQEYWSGLPRPPPGDLPIPGIEPASPCLLHWRWILSPWVTGDFQTGTINWGVTFHHPALSFLSTGGVLFRYIKSSDLCYPRALVTENPSANAGDVRDTGSNSGSERSPGGGHGNPLQYPCLENPTDRGAWLATVHGGHKESDRTEATWHARKLPPHHWAHIQLLMFSSIWVFKITQGSTGPALKSSWSLNCYPSCTFLTTWVSNLGIILNSLLSLTPHRVLSQCCQFCLFELVASSIPVNLVPVQISINSCLDLS